MEWQQVKMSNDDVVARKHMRLQAAFEAVFVAMLAPRDAAMFTNREIEDHCTYYFSPGAVKIFGPMLQAFGATKCEAPSRDSVAFFFGHAQALEELLR